MAPVVPQEPKRTYEFLQLLAESDLNRVFLARDGTDHKMWAIKELFPPDPDDVAGFHRDFAKEAQQQLHIKHVSLPKVAEYFVHEGNGYLVKEYVEGRTLKDMVGNNRGMLTVDVAMTFVNQIGEALRALHASWPPMIAQGLKPNNIVVPPIGRARLMDLGTARFITGEARRRLLMALTPWYTSPEQAAGEEPDVRSDIYSLGALTYYLMTGTDPIPVDGAVPDIRTARSTLTANVAATVGGALLQDPKARFPSVDAFIRALKDAEIDDHGRHFVVDEMHVQFLDCKPGERIMRTLHVSKDVADAVVRAEADVPWLKPTEREVKGKHPEVDFWVETADLNPDETAYGKIILTSGKFRREVPVTVQFQRPLVNKILRMISARA